MNTAASTTIVSKRNAEYGRSDRAMYKNKNREEIAKRAAQNRWKSVDGQSESLSDVANTPLIATAPHISRYFGNWLERNFKP